MILLWAACRNTSVNRTTGTPGQNARPVCNFRSDGHEFTSCLIIADGFCEFTDSQDKENKRKDKRLLTKKG
jgi:hypothetical protein